MLRRAVVNFRGNVETRLRKLEEGVVDATLLALAGLRRLGLVEKATAVLAIDEFLPAVGQGCLAVVARADDTRVAAAVHDPADHRPVVGTERRLTCLPAAIVVRAGDRRLVAAADVGAWQHADR